MTNREFVLQILRDLGRADALSLRSRAAGMDGTGIIAEEHKIPAWDAGRDYSGWPAGAPVVHDGQVYGLLQPHNASHYGQTPPQLPALWSILHTKDPSRAKDFATPAGTSGLYHTGDCCVWQGAVYRSKNDNNPYSPVDYPAWWEEVTL